jgi:hypothetical protein
MQQHVEEAGLDLADDGEAAVEIAGREHPVEELARQGRPVSMCAVIFDSTSHSQQNFP